MPSEPLDADLSAIIAASADGIVVVDDRGVIRFANPAAESLFERQAKDLLGRRLGLPVATGEPAEIDLVHQGGETVVVEMLSTDASWQGQPARLAILRDVTARRRAEDDLRRALELRDDVAEIVSHELRSPLTSIIGFASTLSARLDDLDREAIREIAQRIEAVGSRMERLVQDLSTVTRLQAGAVEPELRPVEVCSLISRIVGDLGERGAGIVSRCRPGAAVLADADHLERILINYLDNAIRHGEGTIGVDVEEKLPWVQVRVRDRGPGVAPELVPQLFDRLTRPKPPPLPRREGRSARRRREPGRGSDPAVFLRPTGSGLGLS